MTMTSARGRPVIVWAAFLVLLDIAPVKAGEQAPEPTMTYTCPAIRRAVALFSSIWAAEKAARAAGASKAQIEQAKRCLTAAR